MFGEHVGESRYDHRCGDGWHETIGYTEGPLKLGLVRSQTIDDFLQGRGVGPGSQLGGHGAGRLGLSGAVPAVGAHAEAEGQQQKAQQTRATAGATRADLTADGGGQEVDQRNAHAALRFWVTGASTDAAPISAAQA
ncbi:MAG: hypothetical protein ACK56F_00455, partial [bacterium]